MHTGQKERISIVLLFILTFSLPQPTTTVSTTRVMACRATLHHSLFPKAAELADRHYRLGAVPIATYVELQKQYLEAVEALLDTKREALDAGQQLGLLTGLDIHAVHTNP